MSGARNAIRAGVVSTALVATILGSILLIAPTAPKADAGVPVPFSTATVCGLPRPTLPHTDRSGTRAPLRPTAR